MSGVYDGVGSVNADRWRWCVALGFIRNHDPKRVDTLEPPNKPTESYILPLPLVCIRWAPQPTYAAGKQGVMGGCINGLEASKLPNSKNCSSAAYLRCEWNAAAHTCTPTQHPFRVCATQVPIETKVYIYYNSFFLMFGVQLCL